MAKNNKTSSTNVMLPISDKKKAIALGLNISRICRLALVSKIRYYSKKAKKEEAEELAANTPITRTITPDQVTLAGAPAIAEPAEAILDAAIKELEKKKEKDPMGNPDPSLHCSMDQQSCEDGSETVREISAGVDHNAIV